MKLAQTTLSRRDSLKIARRFNAGNGLACASSPAGTAENTRPFRPSLRDSIHFASPHRGHLHCAQGDARRPARRRTAFGARVRRQMRYSLEVELPAYCESAKGGTHRDIEHANAPAYSAPVHAV